MSIRIYTLWANMKGEEPSPWMIAAEDEPSWEGNPERCEKVFSDARALAKKNDWDVRELVLRVGYADIDRVFAPAEAEASVEVEA